MKGTELRPSDETSPYRRQVLAIVQSTWIKSVLEQSLHGFRLIPLELQALTWPVVRPFEPFVQEFEPPPSILSTDTHISTVFESAGRKLLILGGPGSGKTTLLLELARVLLVRAQEDDTAPIPLVVTLSSWVMRQESLASWLVEELWHPDKYNVARAVAQTWIDTDQLVLLLDGLDEVPAAYRAACVDAVNAYRAAHDQAALVVCSRSADYPGHTETARLRLNKAVATQPLTPRQMTDYLASSEEKLAALRGALIEDPLLLELAASPLMLSFMALTYGERQTVDHSTAATVEDRQHEVFAAYVEHMLHRRRRTLIQRYTPRETVHYLAWLARSMLAHHISVFYLEDLQPTWLGTRGQRTAYLALGVVVIALVFSATGAVLGTAITGLTRRLGIDEELGSVSAVEGTGFFLGLAVGLLIGLGFAVYAAVRRADEVHIRPVETIRWTWPSLGEVCFGAACGAVGGALVGAVYGGFPTPAVPRAGLGDVLHGAVFGAVSAIPAGVVSGALLSGLRIVSVESPTAPNQGIWRSAHSALRGGLRGALIGALIGGVTFGPFLALVAGVAGGLPGGPASPGILIFECTEVGAVVGALLGMLRCGGDVCLWHLMLRLFLWRRRCIPLNYVGFLDASVNHILLRKAGGGYMFAHRRLLEYFALQQE